MNSIQPDFSNDGDHHSEIKRLARGRPINLVLDVGANIGITVRRYLREFETARVIAFEPIQPAYAALRARVGASARVCCMNVALAAAPGTATVHHQEHLGLNSLYPPINVPEPTCMTSEEVQIMTLDQIVRENAIEHIDVLKLDTEHLDVDVLRGGERTLTQRRITFVYSEVAFDPTDQRHTQYSEINEDLTPHGFETVGFFEPIYLEDPKRLFFCNALFVRTDYLVGSHRM